jgi:Flp pilus assembly protein TadG
MLMRRPAARRRAATAVETAVVLLPLTMFLFSVFEYGRYLMDVNLMNNAAREGCRYALANNTSSTISSDVQNIVTTYLSTETSSFTGLTVTVSGTHQGTATAVNNLAPGDLITVTVTGNYKFLNIVPLVPMPSSVNVTTAPTMVCEGGT